MKANDLDDSPFRDLPDRIETRSGDRVSLAGVARTHRWLQQGLCIGLMATATSVLAALGLGAIGRNSPRGTVTEMGMFLAAACWMSIVVVAVACWFVCAISALSLATRLRGVAGWLFLFPLALVLPWLMLFFAKQSLLIALLVPPLMGWGSGLWMGAIVGGMLRVHGYSPGWLGVSVGEIGRAVDRHVCACGYDLAGIAGPQCPECGAAIPEVLR